MLGTRIFLKLRSKRTGALLGCSLLTIVLAISSAINYSQSRSTSSKIPIQISNQVIATLLAKTLNDQLPLKLDSSTVLPPVSLDETSFQPTQLTLTAANLERRLPPGDYAIPVTMYCTKDSLHVAGRGVGYALAYMQGKSADALSMLYLRGALKGTSWRTLQTISWGVQSSFTYSQMHPAHRQVIDDLIPEYRSRLSGDFLQSFETQYNALARQFGPQRLPRLDQILSHTGAFGVKVAELRRSREIIRRNALNFDRLQQQLVNTTITADEKSPWSQIRPGIYARLKVVRGYGGLNWLEVRMARGSSGASPLEALYGISSVNSELRSAIDATERANRQSVVKAAYLPPPSPKNGGGLIGYPIQQPAQTHAIVPLLTGAAGPAPPQVSGAGGGPEGPPGPNPPNGPDGPGNPPCVDPQQGNMPCDSHRIYKPDTSHKKWYEDQQVRVETGMQWTNAGAPKDCGEPGIPLTMVLNDGITITVKNCKQNPRIVQFISREQRKRVAGLPNGELEAGTYPKSTGCSTPPIPLSLATENDPAWHVDGTPYYNSYRMDCDKTNPDSMTIFDRPNFDLAKWDPTKYWYWQARFVSFVLCDGQVIRQVRWSRRLGSNGFKTIDPEYSVEKNVMPDPKDINKFQCLSEKPWVSCNAMNQNTPLAPHPQPTLRRAQPRTLGRQSVASLIKGERGYPTLRRIFSQMTVLTAHLRNAS
jgi:hypothetical protein